MAVEVHPPSECHSSANQKAFYSDLFERLLAIFGISQMFEPQPAERQNQHMPSHGVVFKNQVLDIVHHLPLAQNPTLLL